MLNAGQLDMFHGQDGLNEVGIGKGQIDLRNQMTIFNLLVSIWGSCISSQLIIDGSTINEDLIWVWAPLDFKKIGIDGKKYLRYLFERIICSVDFF